MGTLSKKVVALNDYVFRIKEADQALKNAEPSAEVKALADTVEKIAKALDVISEKVNSADKAAPPVKKESPPAEKKVGPAPAKKALPVPRESEIVSKLKKISQEVEGKSKKIGPAVANSLSKAIADSVPKKKKNRRAKRSKESYQSTSFSINTNTFSGKFFSGVDDADMHVWYGCRIRGPNGKIRIITPHHDNSRVVAFKFADGKTVSKDKLKVAQDMNRHDYITYEDHPLVATAAWTIAEPKLNQGGLYVNGRRQSVTTKVALNDDYVDHWATTEPGDCGGLIVQGESVAIGMHLIGRGKDNKNSALSLALVKNLWDSKN